MPVRQGRSHQLHRAPRQARHLAAQHQSAPSSPAAPALRHRRERNQAFGVDASFAFSHNPALAATWRTRPRTDGVTGDATSYRTHFNYAADRYGPQARSNRRRRQLQSRSGIRAPHTSFASNYGDRCASARGHAERDDSAVLLRDGNIDYITDNQDQLESRNVTASARVDLQNSDSFALAYQSEWELLERPFVPAAGIVIPAGRYSFRHVRASWTPGQQHRLSGVLAVDVGEFYDGTRQDSVGQRQARHHRPVRHRTKHLAELAESPGRKCHGPRRRRPRRLHHDATHVRRRVGAVLLDRARPAARTSAFAGSTCPAASCSSSTPMRTTRPAPWALTGCRTAEWS